MTLLHTSEFCFVVLYNVFVGCVREAILYQNRWFFTHRVKGGGQSPKNLVGALALPTGKFLRVRKVFARIYKITHKNWRVIKCGKFSESLKSFRTVWKLSRRSKKFPDGLESFQMVWKIFSWSGKLTDSLEIFLTVWKVSGERRKFQDTLESF